MLLGRSAFQNGVLKNIYPTAALQIGDDEMFLQWMEGETLAGDVFTVADPADVTRILTVNTDSDIEVTCLSGGSGFTFQPSVQSSSDETPSPNTDAFITSFKFNISATDYVASITDDEIAVTLPNGTVVTSLTPIATISSEATVDPAFAAADFTNPRTYTVTAEDGTTDKVYTVTVTVAP